LGLGRLVESVVVGPRMGFLVGTVSGVGLGSASTACFPPFIERATSSPGQIFPAGRVTFTDSEKEVLELLGASRSNKEIGSVLGITERTVKAHVAKLLHKVGVQNRIALSVHAITHCLVTAKQTSRQGCCEDGVPDEPRHPCPLCSHPSVANLTRSTTFAFDSPAFPGRCSWR